MMNWLNTIRWKNLIIIWVSILVVILPHYDLWNSPVLLNEFIWWAIICSSVAAIGNITNDWLDIKQDRENKKKNIFVNKKNKQKAIVFILVLTLIAIIAILFSRLQGYFSMLAAIALFLLLCYNTFLKKLPLVGNIVIAVLTGLIFFGVDLIVMSRIVYFEFGVNTIQIELLGMFAFLTTLIREILKDAEDRRGDMFAGFHTIARFLNDKWIAVLILILVIAGSLIINYILFKRSENPYYMIPFLYYGIFTLAITTASAINLLIAHPSKYVRATRIIKAGMLGCLVIYLFLSL